MITSDCSSWIFSIGISRVVGPVPAEPQARRQRLRAPASRAQAKLFFSSSAVISCFWFYAALPRLFSP